MAMRFFSGIFALRAEALRQSALAGDFEKKKPRPVVSAAHRITSVVVATQW
jgi:hypothetical protein